MNFFFVDRILDLVPGRQVKGLKHVTTADTYLRHNDAGEIIFYPSLVGEALGQLSAWCVMAANHFTLRPVAGILQMVRLHGEATIGDTILLETIIDSVDEEATQYHSLASVRGKPILELIHAVGPFLPMAQFNDVNEVRQQFAMINRPDENWQDTSLPLQKGLLPDQTQIQFATGTLADGIIAFTPGVQVVAQKKIPLLAPYFPDHFALKPVFPLSLLLETQLQLVRFCLQQECLGSVPMMPIHTIKRIKTNAFIEPGDTIEISCDYVEQTATQRIFQLTTTREGKRIAAATVLCGENHENAG